MPFLKPRQQFVHALRTAASVPTIQQKSVKLAKFSTMTSIKDLKVHRGWTGQGSHVWSPFVVKLEARLRFANVRYTTGAGGPRGAPKGKIPYVEFQPADGQEMVQMGDSTLIVKHFIEEGVLPDLNGRLSPEDRARDLATRALLEEKLCFYHVRCGTRRLFKKEFGAKPFQ